MKMKNKFDTQVQVLKCDVLKEVASLACDDKLIENILEIPEKIIPGNKPTMRCCVYKERAVLTQRIKLAIGGNKINKKTIQVIDIACEDCPAGGYEVTERCRSCLAHRCAETCGKNAITFGSDQKAHIDKNKCVECGMCASVCPYHAIINFKRPCESACKVNAISEGENNQAKINYDKCISCGACAYACPFGAITDRSYILDAIDILKKRGNVKNNKIFAIVAPSVAGQFVQATIGQIFSAIKHLGFSDVVEVALGADFVAFNEGIELEEKGFLISSCCPSFVSYIEKNFPNLACKISSSLSPAGTTAKILKGKYPDSKIVFIGPCTAKKDEYRKSDYSNLIDCVLTYEELQALMDIMNVQPCDMPEVKVESASAFGRGLGKSGGLSKAVEQGLKERRADFVFRPVVCNGLDECKATLLKYSNGIDIGNFIEGMACKGGCINGAGCISHSVKNMADFSKYCNESNLTISENIKNR